MYKKIILFTGFAIIITFSIVAIALSNLNNQKTQEYLPMTTITSSLLTKVDGESTINPKQAMVESQITTTSTKMKATVWDLLNDRPVFPLKHKTISDYAKSLGVNETKVAGFSDKFFNMDLLFSNEDFLIHGRSIRNSDDLETLAIYFKKLGECKNGESESKITEVVEYLGFKASDVSGVFKPDPYDSMEKAKLNYGDGTTLITISCSADNSDFTHYYYSLSTHGANSGY